MRRFLQWLSSLGNQTLFNVLHIVTSQDDPSRFRQLPNGHFGFADVKLSLRYPTRDADFFFCFSRNASAVPDIDSSDIISKLPGPD